MYDHLDVYVLMLIITNGMDYVCENYLSIRETYYENKYGG